jgi:hypothetical protein
MIPTVRETSVPSPVPQKGVRPSNRPFSILGCLHEYGGHHPAGPELTALIPEAGERAARRWLSSSPSTSAIRTGRRHTPGGARLPAHGIADYLTNGDAHRGLATHGLATRTLKTLASATGNDDISVRVFANSQRTTGDFGERSHEFNPTAILWRGRCFVMAQDCFNFRRSRAGITR